MLEHSGVYSGLCFDGQHFWNRIGYGKATTFFDSYFGHVLNGITEKVVTIPNRGERYDTRHTLPAQSLLAPQDEQSTDVIHFAYTKTSQSWQPHNISVEAAMHDIQNNTLEESMDVLYIPWQATARFLFDFLRGQKTVEGSLDANG